MAYGGVGVQMLRLAASILNKQEWSSVGAWREAKIIDSFILERAVRSPALPQILNADLVWNGVHPTS